MAASPDAVMTSAPGAAVGVAPDVTLSEAIADPDTPGAGVGDGCDHGDGEGRSLHELDGRLQRDRSPRGNGFRRLIQSDGDRV